MDNWCNLEWLVTGSSEHKIVKGIKEATENTGEKIICADQAEKSQYQTKETKFRRGQEAGDHSEVE